MIAYEIFVSLFNIVKSRPVIYPPFQCVIVREREREKIRNTKGKREQQIERRE